MSGRIGERVMGENISIWDDGASPRTASRSPSTPKAWHGSASTSSWTASRATSSGTATTAASASTRRPATPCPPGLTYGPMPFNLFLGTGDATKEEMVASIKRGVWVSRFWYTRPVHPLNVVLTGMTRDGTFLIEDGKIVAPVKNLRFTQSYLEAMNNVEMIGRESRLLPSYCRVPALKIRNWTFTGITE